jgi:formylglycine-generating enzyme required for sulfatase activity
MTKLNIGRVSWKRRTLTIGALKLTSLVALVGCSASTNSDPDPANGGSAGTGSASGGSAGTSKGGSAGTAGSAGTGGTFECTSNAAPGRVVDVPAGDFIMGCNGEVDDECDGDEMPMHMVTLAAFEIEETEVTQEAYAACVTDGD